MRANTLIPFTLMAAASLVTVSFGPWLLRKASSPSAAIAALPIVSRNDLDDAHHPLVLVIDRVTVIDETADDHGIRKGNDHFQYARPIGGRRQRREGVAQTVLVLTHAVDLRHQKARLMDVKAVILLIGVDDGPL